MSQQEQQNARVMTISDFFKCIEEQTEATIKTIEAMYRFYPGVAPDRHLKDLRELEAHCKQKALEFKGDMRTPEDFKDTWHWSLPH